ncbi:beta-1,3-galactosyltransferase 5-like [Danaus plexippus]|uniref:beta-1,3-galactosyltransferase 5-like n=1 Tax=Danaus plexippus TaxID=13037 RepID=UPI002AAFA510|nr:beta-1,3-galactosyltransferase 5-like [Danaus plexippus]
MTKKVVAFILIALLSLVVWVYRSSNFEYNNNIVLIKQNTLFKHALINPLNTTCDRHPLFVIIVTSYVGHVELRSAHRRAMPLEYLAAHNATRVFLLAKIPGNERYITQEAINDESNTFGDILQGQFYENYRNLTYKHLMGLQWASTTCSAASFILKVDDDTVFNFERTYEYIKTLSTNKSNSLIGYILNNTQPRRNTENKWFVTYEEYPRSVYPQYLSGWYYIITPDAARIISQEATYHPYFWIDDIFVTGLLTESLGLKLKQLPLNYWLEYYELLECCLRDMIKKSIVCDYTVGPNGSRNNLIVEFNEAYRNCHKWGNCTRPNDYNLKKECVVSRERTIFSDGKAIIDHEIL